MVSARDLGGVGLMVFNSVPFNALDLYYVKPLWPELWRRDNGLQMIAYSKTRTVRSWRTQKPECARCGVPENPKGVPENPNDRGYCT